MFSSGQALAMCKDSSRIFYSQGVRSVSVSNINMLIGSR